MPSLFIAHAHAIATVNDQAEVLRDASLFIREGRIAAMGPAHQLQHWREQADEVIDGRGLLVTPGLVNTHHHMYQSLTRAIPEVQNAELYLFY